MVFQGSCKYLLASDCSNKPGPTFSIRITNDARNSYAFSWLRTVTLRLFGFDTKISLLQGMKVKVNGSRVDLPFIKLAQFSIFKDGYRVRVRLNTGERSTPTTVFADFKGFHTR